MAAAAEARGGSAASRRERDKSIGQMQPELLKAAAERGKRRGRRVEARKARCKKEEVRVAAQSKTEKILFPSRAKEEAELTESAEDQARSVDEYQRHTQTITAAVEEAAADASALELEASAVGREKGLLAEGNPKLDIEGSSSGTSALGTVQLAAVQAPGSWLELVVSAAVDFEGARDEELAALRSRRLAADEALVRLAKVNRVEEEAKRSRKEEAALAKRSELLSAAAAAHAAEAEQIIAEETLVAREQKALDENEEALAKKTGAAEAACEALISERREKLQLAEAHASAAAQRDAEEKARADEAKERLAARSTWAPLHEARLARSLERLALERGWHERIARSEGVPFLPDRGALLAERAEDEETRAAFELVRAAQLVAIEEAIVANMAAQGELQQQQTEVRAEQYEAGQLGLAARFKREDGALRETAAGGTPREVEWWRALVAKREQAAALHDSQLQLLRRLMSADYRARGGELALQLEALDSEAGQLGEERRLVGGETVDAQRRENEARTEEIQATRRTDAVAAERVGALSASIQSVATALGEWDVASVARAKESARRNAAWAGTALVLEYQDAKPVRCEVDRALVEQHLQHSRERLGVFQSRLGEVATVQERLAALSPPASAAGAEGSSTDRSDAGGASVATGGGVLDTFDVQQMLTLLKRVRDEKPTPTASGAPMVLGKQRSSIASMLPRSSGSSPAPNRLRPVHAVLGPAYLRTVTAQPALLQRARAEREAVEDATCAHRGDVDGLARQESDSEEWFETWHGEAISTAAGEALALREVVRAQSAALAVQLADEGKALAEEVSQLDARVSLFSDCGALMDALGQAYAHEEAAISGLKAAVATAELAVKAAVARTNTVA